MNPSTETVASTRPFIAKRTVRWTDCDPAGVVFAGHYPGYLISALMLFMQQIGYGPGEQETHGVLLPCKHMSLTFHISLYPENVVDIHVSVGEIRTRTFDLVAKATLPDGELAFEGVFSPICIHSTVRESTEIPKDLRTALQSYQSPETLQQEARP